MATVLNRAILELHVQLVLTSNWLELSHMATAAAREAGKCSLFSRWPDAPVTFRDSILRKKGRSILGDNRRLLTCPGLGLTSVRESTGSGCGSLG